MRSTILHPRPYTRSGMIRRWWHLRRNHLVAMTVVRDYRKHGARLDFYFRPGFVCVTCKMDWP